MSFAGCFFFPIAHCRTRCILRGSLLFNITRSSARGRVYHHEYCRIRCGSTLQHVLHFAAFDATEYCKVWHVSQASLQLILWDLSPLPFAGFVASARICRNRLSQDLLQLPLTGFVVITFCRTRCMLQGLLQLHIAGFAAFRRTGCN